MKKLIAVCGLLLSIGVFSVQAQSSNWRNGTNEINIGVKPFHFGPTSIQYKGKLSKRNWMRIGITDLDFRNGETGLRIGIEKQRNLLLRSRFTYGLEPGIALDYDRTDNNFSSYNVDLGVPVGVQIHLSKKILIGFEARPSIGIYENTFVDGSPERSASFGGGLDFFNGVKTTLGYRF